MIRPWLRPHPPDEPADTVGRGPAQRPQDAPRRQPRTRRPTQAQPAQEDQPGPVQQLLSMAGSMAVTDALRRQVTVQSVQTRERLRPRRSEARSPLCAFSDHACFLCSQVACHCLCPGRSLPWCFIMVWGHPFMESTAPERCRADLDNLQITTAGRSKIPAMHVFSNDQPMGHLHPMQLSAGACLRFLSCSGSADPGQRCARPARSGGRPGSARGPGGRCHQGAAHAAPSAAAPWQVQRRSSGCRAALTTCKPASRQAHPSCAAPAPTG